VPRIRLVALPLLLALSAALAACGGSGADPAATTIAQPPLTGAQTTATTPLQTTFPATQTATAPAPTTTTTVPTTTTPTTPATSTPASGGAPAGCPGAVGGFIRDVQASGTDCDHAREVANAWFSAVHGGADPSSQIAAGGYTCTGAMSGERASVACTGGSGGAAVSFTASP
jgi:hypothetical protein